MDRQEGYYWVKYKDSYQIAFWGLWLTNKFAWFCIANEEIFEDKDFEHINEVRIKEPGELLD
jgi:hypothetical protein